jgi:hypothetical protein
LITTSRGVFIGVKGGVTDLVMSVRREVVAGQPSHVAGQPWTLVSTDLQLGIPLHYVLESVTMKPTHERLQGGAGQLGGLVGWSADFAHYLLMLGTPPG